MALFRKAPEQPAVPKVEEKPAAPAVAEEKPQKKEEKPAFSPMYQTKIGKGITFYGDFEAKDPIEINGNVEGSIDSSNTVSVSETGVYHGVARMKEFQVAGVVDGNIDCSDISSFTATSKMSGRLTTARLRTDDGADMEADIRIKPKAAKAPAAVAAEAPAEEPKAKAPDARIADLVATLAEEGDVPVTEADLFN